MASERQRLVRAIRRAGYSVEWVEYCEDAETPGLLGQAAGVTCHGRKAVKVRRTLSRDDTLAVLRHELRHVLGEKIVDESQPGYQCGGSGAPLHLR